MFGLIVEVHDRDQAIFKMPTPQNFSVILQNKVLFFLTNKQTKISYPVLVHAVIIIYYSFFNITISIVLSMTHIHAGVFTPVNTHPSKKELAEAHRMH